MEIRIASEFDAEGVTEEEIQEMIEEIQEHHPELEVEVSNAEEVFPTGIETGTLILIAKAGLDIALFLYPVVRERLEDVGGDVEITNLVEISKDILVQHTRVSESGLELSRTETLNGDVEFYFRYESDGSIHKIRINRNTPEEWEYMEI